MCALFEHRLLFRIFHINLRTFQNLQRNSTIRIISQERSSTRFTYILYHTAHAHRTIKLLTQINYQVGIFHILDVFLATTQLLLDETNNTFKLFMAIMTTIQQFQIIECLFLKRHQHTCQQFFVGHSIFFQPVRNHVINVLDKHNIGIQIIQVFNQCSMTTRTEYQLPFIIAERFVVHVCCDSICTGFLFGERNIIFHFILFRIFTDFGIHQFGKQCTMFGRNSEVYIYLTGFSGSIQSTFYQMFFQWRTYPVSISMELQQALWK
ncbi:oRF2 [Bacteroides sp. CAG:702]|nr:oRF2 [Bacteroides sp. CAG:702]